MCQLSASFYVSIVVEILVFSTIRVHGQPIGPTNISRQIEDTNVIIPCPYSFISPPIWSIGGVLYDYSALPPPYATAAGGDLVITTIDDSLNNVSFQCIVTTIDGEILQSDIGILTVTGISNGSLGTHDNQPQLAINHQNFVVNNNSIELAWRTVNNGTDCQNYSFSSSDCNPSVNFRSYLEYSEDQMITLEDTQGSPYYNITAFTRNGAMCRFSSPLHRFRVQDTGTKIFNTIPSSRMCPFCFKLPTIESGLTLTIVIPSRHSNVDEISEPQADLLCPLKLIENQCANLSMQCDHFIESIYSRSITICPGANSTGSVCLDNFGITMNDTVIHFYTLHADCFPNNILDITRVYIESRRIIIQRMPGDFNVTVNISTQQLCVYSQSNECYEFSDLDGIEYTISLTDPKMDKNYTNTTRGNPACITIEQLTQLRCTSPLILSVDAVDSSSILLYEPLTVILEENNTFGDSCECGTYIHRTYDSEVSEGSIKYNCSCPLSVSGLNPEQCSDSSKGSLLTIIIVMIVVISVGVIIMFINVPVCLYIKLCLRNSNRPNITTNNDTSDNSNKDSEMQSSL